MNQPEQITFYYRHEPYGPWWQNQAAPDADTIEPEAFVTATQAYRQTSEGQFIEQQHLTYAHHADFLRLKILLEKGGIYADMDTLFLQPLPEELYARSFVLGVEDPVQSSAGRQPQVSLCNAVILSEPNAAFGRQWLANMYQVFDGTWSQHSCLEAGRLSQLMPDAIHICPQRFFYKHRSTPAGIQTLLLGRDYDYADMYSLHLWAHLWWDKQRRDFALFTRAC